jgi:hypothetical protein
VSGLTNERTNLPTTLPQVRQSVQGAHHAALPKLQGGKEMNCCDEYGNCRQGRDCPCRKEVTKESWDKIAEYLAIGMICIMWMIALVFGLTL